MIVKNKTILLVEDEVLIAMEEAWMLEDRGFDVIIAHSGDDAVATAGRTPGIDLILMDIDLGRGMDGTGAAEIILRDHDVPVLFLSSHTEPEIVEKTEGITSYGYVVKNSGETVLLASIKMAFRLFEARKNEHAKEEALREALQTSTDIVQAIPSGLFIYQYEEHDRLILLEGNREAEKLTGLSVDAWRGREFNEIWPEARNAGVTQAYLDVLRTGNMFETEDLYYADGRIEGAFRVRAFPMPGKRLGVAFENITERKRSEKDLLNSEQHFRFVFDNAIVGMFISTPAGKFEYVNHELARLFGYDSPDDLMRTVNRSSIADALYEDPARRAVIVDEVESSRGSWKVFENRFRKKDGTVIDTMLSFCETISPATGERLLYGFVRDITGHKRAEMVLKESEEKFRRLSEDMPAYICSFLPDSTMLYVNPALAAITGLSQDELAGGRFFDMLDPHEEESLRNRLEALTPDNPVGKHVQSYTDREGRARFHEWTNRAFFDANGKACHYQAVGIDITERRRTEAELLRIDGLFHLITENITEGVVLADMNMKVEYSSPSTRKRHGYSFEEQRSIPLERMLTRESYGRLMKIAAEELTAEKLSDPNCDITRVVDLEFICKDGTTYWSESSYRLLRDSEGRPTGILGVGRDITERKRAQEALRESEEKYRAIVESTLIGVGIARGNDIIYANRALLDMFGYECLEDFLVKPLLEHAALESRQSILERFEKIRRGESVDPYFVHDIIRRDGARRTLQLYVSTVTINGEECRQSTFIDITGNKHAEEELRASEERYRSLVENINLGIFTSTLDGRFLEANPAVARIGGYGSVEEFKRVPASRLYADPADRDLLVGMLRETGSVKGVEIRSVKKDGSVCWISMSAVLTKDADGKPGGIIGFIDDITVRKRAERLIEAERDLSVALSGVITLRDALQHGLAAAMSVSEMECGGVYLVDNSGALDLAVHEGLSDDFVGMVSHFGADSPNAQMVRRGEMIYFDTSGVTGRLEEKYLNGMLMSLVRKEGLESLAILPVGLMGEFLACMNISSRVRGIISTHTRMALESIAARMGSAILRIRAQEALVERERRFRSYFDMPLVGVAITSPAKGWMEVNDRTCEILGYPRSELYRRTWAELTHPDDLTADVALFERVMSGEIDSYSMDKRFIRGDGEVVWTALAVGCVRHPDSTVNYIVALLNDITERKRAEEALVRAGEEKQALHRELQHRIKNTLALITSLVGLEAGNAREPVVKDAMEKIRGRIGAIADLYSHLYESGGAGEVRLDRYLLKIGDSIREAFGERDGKVDLIMEMEEAVMDIKRASSMGLILNELLTNAYKYAFDGIEAGAILVRLMRNNGVLGLSVTDTGSGLPCNVDPANSQGFGLNITRMMAKQLGGVFEYELGSMTTFRVKVPVQ